MARLSKKEEIQQFRRQATEEDFNRLKELITTGKVSVSIGRGKSRALLKRTQKGYYYASFGSAILLAAATLYCVAINQTWLAGFGFATTVVIMIRFWRSMTRRMSAWSVEEKKNFDYAYFTNVISLKKDDEEFHYPEYHWKDVL